MLKARHQVVATATVCGMIFMMMGIINSVAAQGPNDDTETLTVVPKTVIDIPVDEVRMIKINRIPSSIVLGNPLIADAVIEGNRIIYVLGRTYGTTNMIVIDEMGFEIAHYDINVRAGGRNSVSVFRGTERYMLNCSPLCENELDVGDAGEHYDIIRQQVEGKTALSEAQAVSRE